MGRTKTVVFSIIPVAVLLITLEVIGRIIYPFEPWERAEMIAERDPRRELWENRPVDPFIILADINGMEKRYVSFLGWIGAPDLKLTTLQTNSIGFRDDTVGARAPNEYRILLLGGSAAWGWGASSNQSTVSGALEELMNEDSGPDTSYRVMNAAYLAWTSLQERVVLMEFYDKFDPDLVISLSGFNDIIGVQWGQSRDLLRMEYGMIEDAVNNQLKPMDTLTAIRKVAGTLGIWRNVVYIKEIIRNRTGKKIANVDYYPERAKYGIPKIIDRYASMGEFAHRRGAQYLVALQPDIYTSGKVLSTEEVRIKAWLDSKHGENFDATFAQYRSDLVQAASSAGGSLSLVDLRPIFDEIPQTMFSDDSHFNDEGYREIARTLKKVIQER